jgi:hypothetical protein
MTEQKVMGNTEREATVLMTQYGLFLPKPVRIFIQKMAAKIDVLEKGNTQ